MKEAYVKFETAKRLKEGRFNWPCTHYYDDGGTMHEARDYVIQNDGDEDDNDECICPTQQMACLWLRETHGLWVIPMPCENGGCYFEIYKRYGKIWKNDVYDHTEYEDFDEPEDAIEAALKYCLTNLI